MSIHPNPTSLLRLALVGSAFAWGAAGAGVAAAAVITEEFAVSSGGATFPVRLQAPAPENVAEHPLLLIFLSADRQSAMPDGRYGAPGRVFLERGHRVVSFDLPAHGERVDRHGADIAGLAAQVAAGEAPFDRMVEDGRAVIDECVRRGWAEKDRIVVAGVSRGGYCALRLAAEDPRVSAVAAFAPVTDWRILKEFAAQKAAPTVAALALSRFADRLAGRRVFLAIGNLDLRVGTDACTQFVLALNEAERRRGVTRSQLRYVIADDSVDHRLAAKWREAGMTFLLGETVLADPAPAP
jgi:esterase FrsA